ncbi:hypothetical protein Mapa_009350 [Marchantia paleacea]|nr:hypothetical protein Mapa_009350 [Marchantia paleacea]
MTSSLGRLRFLLRLARHISSPFRVGSVHFSSLSENELSVVAASVEERSKKTAPPGKKSVAERILTVCDKIYERHQPPALRRGGFMISSDPTRLDTDIMNVAEQRIMQSVRRGEFENLPGKGKPLKLESNLHADPAEDLAYRILAKNGFAPEWVELNKEIRYKVRRWRMALELAWQRRLQAISGGEAQPDDLKWESLLPNFESELKEINQKVMKYNLLVPFGRQLMCYKLEREIKMLREAEPNESSTP